MMMKIERIVSQHRRDFIAIYQCEHCGHEHEGIGYDDTYFHVNVVPKKECPKCDKMSPSDHRPLTTKHPDHKIV